LPGVSFDPEDEDHIFFTDFQRTTRRYISEDRSLRKKHDLAPYCTHCTTSSMTSTLMYSFTQQTTLVTYVKRKLMTLQQHLILAVSVNT
jgi:hypothetical protein